MMKILLFKKSFLKRFMGVYHLVYLIYMENCNYIFQRIWTYFFDNIIYKKLIGTLFKAQNYLRK